jgi:hypothetical protein
MPLDALIYGLLKVKIAQMRGEKQHTNKELKKTAFS